MGVETIQLNVPNPDDTQHYSITKFSEASFTETFTCWQIDKVDGFIKFNLNLPIKMGVTFIFELCSSIGESGINCPITIKVNDNTLVSDFDPKIDVFYLMSWFAPPNFLKTGDNEVKLKLAGGTSKVFIRSAGFLEFDMQHQKQDQWCWSAVSTSTSIFYNCASPWTQCTLVNNALGQSDCCQDGSSSACNQPWYLDQALQITGNLNFMTSTSEPVQTLQTEVNMGNSLGARIGWSGGGGHFVMLTGVGDSQKKVAVQDPWFGLSYISYTTFKDNYQGSGTWTHSYFTQA